MKRIFIILFLFVLVFPLATRAEEISSFKVAMEVNPNGKFLVVEKIVYDFGVPMVEKHGIYRDIPYQYKIENKTREIGLKVLSVKDENGASVNYERSTGNGVVRLKIGKANVLVSGLKTYVITYEISDAVNFFDNQDEIYWNVTGNGWEVPIILAEARISAPFFGTEKDKIQAVCYTGVYGAKDKNCQIGWQGEEIVLTAGSLAASEGLSVAVGWPKGLVKGPSEASILWNKIRQFLPLLFPIIIFIYLYIYWKKHGKDPAGRGTIIPEYEPPKQMLPGEGGVVIDEKMDTRDITATVIDLARRGYFKLAEVEKKVLGIGAGKDWKIIKTKEADANLSDFEKELYDTFLSGRQEVLVSDLKQQTTARQHIKKMKELVYEAVVVKGWFAANPDKARQKFVGIGTAIIIGLFVAGGALGLFQFGAIMIISLIISAALFIIFGKYMPQKTEEGALAKEYLDGFKMFLSVTEKDRVEFHFSPSAHPEKFAEYLPWAIIFGVEKQWAEVFKGIDLPAPDWYEGNWSGMYTAMILSDSLHSFDSNFSKAMTAVGASAAAGGASGFGGGGFSGGGFGGGGGGSW
ncbi:MAG: DUF2207 domain-containing protein [Patescibacteria group bacterium]|nr:DUF2207 domain-containing protein [Patescibacteria group bacterium]